MPVPTHQPGLILLTNQFPYGIGEAFLESEIPFLTQSFSKVVVLSKNKKDPNTRYQAANFHAQRINPRSDLKEKILSVVLLITRLKKVGGYLINEYKYLRGRRERVTFSHFSIMLHDVLKGLIMARHIKRAIHEHKLTGPVVLYSYWLTSSALALTLADHSGGIKRISRAHHVDIYESVNPRKYIPFREILARELNGIFVISQHGVDHLKSKLDIRYHPKLFLSRLGTKKQDLSAQPKKSDAAFIVSCSFVHRIKRVHLIVEALSLIDSLTIQWIHFGDGPLRAEVEQLATERLSAKKNIQFSFRGKFRNEELLRFYRENQVELLMNVSSSEGLPVSIMEAQSFGIPAVAMDVGGVSEIVTPDTGVLLPREGTPAEIASAITRLLTMSAAQKELLRQKTLSHWKDKYNAADNFPTFIEKILTL